MAIKHYKENFDTDRFIIQLSHILVLMILGLWSPSLMNI